jgi:hypothetical protein
LKGSANARFIVTTQFKIPLRQQMKADK